MEKNIQKENQKIADFLSQNPLFFVGSETDENVLIALKPSYQAQYRTIYWWDTSVEKAKVIDQLHTTGEKGVLFFTDPERNNYRFIPMTMEIYNAAVKPRINGADYTDIHELVKAFEETAY